MCRRIPIWGTYLVNAPDILVSTSWQLLFQVAFIEGGMQISMGRVTRDFLINFRLCPTQWSPNLFRVLGSVDMINKKMETNFTCHDINWVYNCQKGKETGYFFKCRVPLVRLISCVPESNKGMDEDFLIISGE